MLETTNNFTFEAGKLFLGISDKGNEVGIPTDRHAITIAGSRSGKGACAIIPNLLRWPHNALVIDPKGENAEKTWKARQDMGAVVHVIEPFRENQNIPDEIRASFNPLDNVNPDSLRAGSDLKVIADGLVKRTNPQHALWDDGAVSLLAGVMAFVIDRAPEDERHLKSVRDLLMKDRDDLYETAQHMKDCDACDGLAISAGTIIMTSIENEKAIEGEFLNSARRNTEWVGIKAMRSVLEKSTFSLADLKTGNATVYLVLPPEYLREYANFLRLFVRCAINVMAAGGTGQGKRCLFILDEFYSLGKIDEISSSCGLMPSYGVHLWPFLQDLGQLLELYGTNGAETFFANADLHQFFGNSDPMTLQHISQRLGVVGTDEMPDAPDAPSQMNMGVGNMVGGAFGHSKQSGMRVAGGIMGGVISGIGNMAAGLNQADYQNKMNEYQQSMAQLGKPRYAPDEVAKIVQKSNDVVAPFSICFISGFGSYLIKTAPYFREVKPPISIVGGFNLSKIDIFLALFFTYILSTWHASRIAALFLYGIPKSLGIPDLSGIYYFGLIYKNSYVTSIGIMITLTTIGFLFYKFTKWMEANDTLYYVYILIGVLMCYRLYPSFFAVMTAKEQLKAWMPFYAILY